MHTGWSRVFRAVRWLLVIVVGIGLVLNPSRIVHAADPPPPDAVTVDASPAGGATFGASVTFTARVDSSSLYIACSPDVTGCPSGVTYSGSVHFIFTMGTTTTVSPDIPLTSYSDPMYGGIGNGMATYQVSNLAVGVTQVTVHYNGRSDGLVAPADSVPLDYTISGATATPTTTTLSANPTLASTTQPFTLTATVTTTADGTLVTTGSVTFSENGTTLTSVPVDNSGTATYTSTGAFTPGSHTVLATYNSSDATYATSSASTTFTMTIPAVSTTGSASPASVASSFGLSLTVNVVATGVTVTGVSVDLTAIGLGIVPLTHASGSATWRTVVTVPASTPVGGPYSLPVTVTDSTSATYNGTPLTVTITREVQSLSITPGGDARVVSGSSQTFGLTATYTNGMSAPVTTGATWRVGDTHVATVDSNGRVTAGTAGTTTLTVSYGGRSTQVTISVVAGSRPTVPPVIPRPAANPMPHVTVPTPVGATPNPAPARH